MQNCLVQWWGSGWSGWRGWVKVAPLKVVLCRRYPSSREWKKGDTSWKLELQQALILTVETLLSGKTMQKLKEMPSNYFRYFYNTLRVLIIKYITEGLPA